MRLDRFITLNLVRPLRVLSRNFRLRTADCGPSGRVLPILMYHSISEDREPGVAPYYRTCTSPRVFGQHMTLLESLGYLGVTLSDGLVWLNAPSQPEIGNRKSEIRNPSCVGEAEPSSILPPPSSAAGPLPVAITFDDGFRDFYTSAAPVLIAHGFGATMYLPSAFIGDSGARRAFRPRKSSRLSTLNSQPSPTRDCLTWPEVRELHTAGIEFGSHTVNHPRLVELDWPEIESEIRDSKSEIEHHLGAAIRSFAYPYAFPQADRSFAKTFGQLLEKAGYESCVTTEINRPRPGDHPLRLARLPANSDDDRAFLAAKLAGDYDWLGPVQLLNKKLFGRRRKHNPPVMVTAEDKMTPSVSRESSHESY